MVGLTGWGMGCAGSRAFKVGPHSQPSMLPMIDLCNHSFNPNCKLEGALDGSAHLVATKDIPKDNAMEINYGNLPNSVLLLDYGFVMAENPHDAADMAVSAQQIQVECIGCSSSHLSSVLQTSANLPSMDLHQPLSAIQS